MVEVKIRNHKFEKAIEVVRSSDPWKVVKDEFKLQVPKSLISLKKKTRTGEQEFQNAKDLFKDLKQDDIFYMSVKQFEIGNFVCTGEEIGSGAFSQVYKGYHKQTQVPAAIKVVDYNLLTNKKAQEYHEREKQIMLLAKHENVVQLFDLQEIVVDGEGKFCYFVMEFCEGGNLEAFLKKNKLNEEQAKKCFKHIVEGLRFLETKSIIHRDLKPQNILLSSSDIDRATLKLCDFGFSRHFTEDELIVSFPCTLLYAPPNFHQGKGYNDNKGDLWALGLIFWELLTSKHLLQVSNRQELDNALRTNLEIKAPADVPLSIEALDLVKKLVEQQTEKRITLNQILEHPFMTKKRIYTFPKGELYETEAKKIDSLMSLSAAVESEIQVPRKDLLFLTPEGKNLVEERSQTSWSTVFAYSLRENDWCPIVPVVPAPVMRNIPLDVSREDLPIKYLLEHQNGFLNVQAQLEEYLNCYMRLVNSYEGSVKVYNNQLKALRALAANLHGEFGGLEMEVNYIRSLLLVVSKPAVDQILSKFNSAIEEMKKTDLPEFLQNSSRKKLIDLIDQDTANREFKELTTIFNEGVAWLKSFDSVKEKFETFKTTEKSFSTLGRYTSELDFKAAKMIKDNAETTAQAVYAQYSKISKEIDQQRSALKQGRPLVNNAECYQTLMVQFKESVLGLRDSVSEVNKMLETLRIKDTLFKNVRSVISLRAEVCKLNSDLIKDNLTNLQDLLNSLQKVICFPENHHAYVAEIKRRAEFQAKKQREIEKAKKIFQKLAEEETKRLRSFKCGVGQQMNSSIYPGIEVEEDFLPIVTEKEPADNTWHHYKSNLSSSESDEEFLMVAGEDPTEIKKENEALQKELASLKLQLENVTATSLLAPLQKIASLQKRLETNNQLLNDYEQRFDSVQKSLGESRMKMDEFEGKSSQLSKLEEDLKKSKLREDDLRIDLKRSQEAYTSLQTKASKLSQDLQSSQDKQEALKQQLKQSIEKLNAAEAKLAALQDLSQKCSKLEGENVALKKATEAQKVLEDEVIRLQGQLANVEKTLNCCPVCTQFFEKSAIQQYEAHVLSHFN